MRAAAVLRDRVLTGSVGAAHDGHIPGAVNVPHDQLAARLADLPAGTDIVAYCRGRYCVFAPAAVRLLRASGFSARPLDGGLSDWRTAGLPVIAGVST